VRAAVSINDTRFAVLCVWRSDPSMRRSQPRHASRRQRVDIMQLKRSTERFDEDDAGERAFPEPHGGATLDVGTHED
jgi:hypothetical protein